MLFGYCFIEVILLKQKYLFFCIIICMIMFIVIDFEIYYIEGITSSYFKFLSMILLFLSANYFKKMILCYTIFCDFLLLFTSWYTLGIAFFIVVHLFYLCQMIPFFEYQKRQQQCMILLLPFGILFSFLPLYIAAICYSIIFLFHIVTSFTQKCNKIYITGLILFALCDCCTAISFLTFNTMAAKCIWILYLPSQILLTTTKQHYFSTALPLPQIKYHCLLHLQKKK